MYLRYNFRSTSTNHWSAPSNKRRSAGAASSSDEEIFTVAPLAPQRCAHFATRFRCPKCEETAMWCVARSSGPRSVRGGPGTARAPAHRGGDIDSCHAERLHPTIQRCAAAPDLNSNGGGAHSFGKVMRFARAQRIKAAAPLPARTVPRVLAPLVHRTLPGGVRRTEFRTLPTSREPPQCEVEIDRPLWKVAVPDGGHDV